MVSDNGPQFKSNEFTQFLKNNGIKQLTTAPFYPASNGEAERMVQTFKKSMKKICTDGTNIQKALRIFLSTYRTTPLAKYGKSPAELLHGRQPRVLLSLLEPHQEIEDKKLVKTKFVIKQPVFVRNFSGRKKWVKGVITKLIGSRLYLVSTNYGEWKRHQNQLKIRHITNTMDSTNDPIMASTNFQTKSIPIAVQSTADHTNKTNNATTQEGQQDCCIQPTTDDQQPTIDDHQPTTNGKHQKTTDDQQSILRRSTREKKQVVRFNC